ncbi:MAG: glycosyltransferase family 4 protein [Mesorhizobium sp.]
MTRRRILIEADNLTLAAGTGIATYARNLASSLRSMDYGTSALVGSRWPLPTSNPVVNRMAFFDLAPNRKLQISTIMRMAFRSRFGAPFGVGTVPLMEAAAVLDPNPAQFAAFDDVNTVYRLHDQARYHFYVRGSPMRIHAPGPVDLFHATQAIPLRVKGVPNVFTIHDLIPLRLPHTTLDEKKYIYGVFRKIARTADHIVTVSEHSRRDILEIFDVPESRVTNTYQAVSLPTALTTRPFDDVAEDLAHLYGLEPRGYFLFVGAIEPKKNVGRIVDAFAASGSKRKLIIAGSPAWMADDDLRKIDDERFRHYVVQGRTISQSKRVERLSYVPFDNLVSLIRGARGLVFPSLYEGFGLPVLEAMMLGTPVITSHVSSLPEIAGDAALLVNPKDTAELARAIRRLDADDDLAAELSARGLRQAAKFGLDPYRERLGAVYRSLLG